MTATLRTAGLGKSWGAFAANSDISLSFAPGARHALIGPNGAGKTTFITLRTGGAWCMPARVPRCWRTGPCWTGW